MFGVYEKEEEGVYEEGVGAGQWPEGALTRGAATHDAMHRYSKLHHVDTLHTLCTMLGSETNSILLRVPPKKRDKCVVSVSLHEQHKN